MSNVREMRIACFGPAVAFEKKHEDMRCMGLISSVIVGVQLSSDCSCTYLPVENRIR